VDSVDKGTVGVTCTGTVSGSCRILDLDFDGDYDSSDATLFDSLPSGWQAREGLTASAVDQPFAHQGLLFEPEIGSYQNRARQYEPGLRRFAQRSDKALLDPYTAAITASANTRSRDANGHNLATPHPEGAGFAGGFQIGFTNDAGTEDWCGPPYACNTRYGPWRVGTCWSQVNDNKTPRLEAFGPDMEMSTTCCTITAIFKCSRDWCHNGNFLWTQTWWGTITHITCWPDSGVYA